MVEKIAIDCAHEQVLVCALNQETLTAGSSISFVLLPEGNTTGDASYTGTGIITGMSINDSMDAIVSRTVTFQGTGALTVGTV